MSVPRREMQCKFESFKQHPEKIEHFLKFINFLWRTKDTEINLINWREKYAEAHIEFSNNT